MFKINKRLMYITEPTDVEGGGDGVHEETQEEPTIEEIAKKYGLHTDEDVDNIVKSKKSKWEQKKQEAVDDAKKKAKMSSEQKQQYELEQAQKRAEEAEKLLAQKTLTDNARSSLIESNINLTEDELNSLVVGADEETTQQNIELVKGLTERIKDEVKTDLLKGSTPTATGSKLKAVTADQFKNMSSRERVEFAKENPEGFHKITGGM